MHGPACPEVHCMQQPAEPSAINYRAACPYRIGPKSLGYRSFYSLGYKGHGLSLIYTYDFAVRFAVSQLEATRVESIAGPYVIEHSTVVI